MAAGAAATIRGYKSKNTVAHPGKPRTISVTSPTAGTRLGGGPGPVVRDRALPAFK